MSAAPVATTVYTERDVLRLLHVRYSPRAGNGGVRYVKAEHVRSHAGFDARRTCDFMALDLWESSGLALHGHEVKISRGDWLRELRNPDKSAEFMQHCDFWWLVAPAGVARLEEVPKDWGLMTINNGRIRVARSAQRLRFPSATGRWSSSHAALVEELNAERRARDTLAAENALLRRSQACGRCRIAEMASGPSTGLLEPMEATL